jgi:(p)ppGpp synthase/HD superfamily hydrolase
MNIVEKAKVFATAAHSAVGQVRKYTGEPYIVHPAEVASIVESVGGTPHMIAAAWLHDTVEDTKVTFDVIQDVFGIEVRELVDWLTDISIPSDGNRAVRKAIDRRHIAAAPAQAQTVKLADLISNTSSIVKHDPVFAKTYLNEKVELMKVLTKGDAVLYARANKMIEESVKKIS